MVTGDIRNQEPKMTSTHKEFYKFKCLSLNEIGVSSLGNCKVIYERSESKCGCRNRIRSHSKPKKKLTTSQSLPCSIANPYTIVLLGELNVGKSAICRNFFRSGLSSASTKSPKANFNEDNEEELFKEHTSDFASYHHIFERPIFVNGVGSRVRILDVNTEKQFLESDDADGFADLSQYLNISDGCVVAYTSTDYSTFETAKEILKKIKTIQLMNNRIFPVVLVANKCDLVRKRQVSTTDGIQEAEKFNVKFIETSAVLSENIEQLFQGIVKQIRLEENLQTIISPPHQKNCTSDCSSAYTLKKQLKKAQLLTKKGEVKEERESLVCKCWRKINQKKETKIKRCLDFTVL